MYNSVIFIGASIKNRYLSGSFFWKIRIISMHLQKYYPLQKFANPISRLVHCLDSFLRYFKCNFNAKVFIPVSKILLTFQYREFGTITELLNICKSSNKEKIPRLCIGTWRNFLNVCPKIAIPVMIGARIFQFLDSSSVKKISDEEVLTDIGVLKEKLNIAIQNLNSLDEYVSELQSGILTWSPPHQSDLFWKENASRLEANDYEILRILTSMLEFDNDPQILAIVANDIGMYVTHHPAGRKSLEILGTKSRIMALFYHSDAEVRYQALSAMQKYMKNMWHTK